MQTNLDARIKALEPVCERLCNASGSFDREQFLYTLPQVRTFLDAHPWLQNWLAKATIETRAAIFALIAIGEGPFILRPPPHAEQEKDLEQLAERLRSVDRFYASLGGVVGYQLTLLKLLRGDSSSPYGNDPGLQYLQPRGPDFSHDSPLRRRAIRAGVEQLSQMGEIYVVGGAGDRLNLFDPRTKEPLPAACLEFGYAGNLLDHLVRDLQAREYLHYQLYGKQLTTPIALMTSEEKKNHEQMIQLCEARNWFGRGKESFFLFTQSQVPVVTNTGHWASNAPLSPLYKPGGHGVLWKLAEDAGVFDWFTSQGRNQVLIRQINNPAAGLDCGLLAFTGLGLLEQKGFGFSSCERRLQAPEGMNVLVETHSGEKHEYRLTNVEYTEFAKHGLQDMPKAPGSPYSVFPANTNILFADLKSVRDVLSHTPVPGLLVNTKTKAPFLDEKGRKSQLPAGRLEGTMQNIADYLTDQFTAALKPEEYHKLRTFITFNTRQKTLSVVKQSPEGLFSVLGTPEHCFYESLSNYRELLTAHCHMELPPLPPPEELTAAQLPFVISLLPALGPLYSVIAQKIQGGRIASGSYLTAEIAELELVHLCLSGGIQIVATHPLGSSPQDECVLYNKFGGKCSLRNVTVLNAGPDFENAAPIWGKELPHRELLEIQIQGNGEFFADGVIFRGSHRIQIANGERVEAKNDKAGGIIFHRSPLSIPSWSWEYTWGEREVLQLRKSS